MTRGNQFSKTFLLITIGLSYYTQTTTAASCEGYKLTISKIEPCQKDVPYVIVVGTDCSAHIDDKCLVYPKVRSAWSAFNVANVTYSITKNNGSQMKGTYDMCNDKQVSHMKSMMQMFGLPHECPVKEGHIELHGDKGIDVAKQKMLMEIFQGKTQLKIHVAHEDGKESCMKATFSLTTKNGSEEDDYKK